jgi:hypothetical protein
MDKKTKITGLILYMALVSLNGFCQEKASNIILGYSENQAIAVYVYEPNLKIMAELESLAQVENKYPEQLAQSILCASSQEWVNYNTLGGEANSSKKKQTHFDAIKSMDKEKNYFELVHKLTFKMEGVNTAVIKFFLIQEGQDPVSGATTMQEIDGRWYTTSNPTLSTMSIIVMRLKSEVLRGIVLGNSSDPATNELRERVITNSALDLVKLEEEFASWYSPEINERKIELYKDPRTW